MKNEGKDLKQLGSNKTEYIYREPIADMLETFENIATPSSRRYTIELDCPEFTSLCVSGDTLIDICMNETKNTEGIPICDLVGTEGLLFSFDKILNKPVARKYYNVRKTQEKAYCVEILILKYKGDGINRRRIKDSIICTPSHHLLVRVGWGKYDWVEARNLKAGMRLVADQRSGTIIRGHARHRLIMESILYRKLTESEVVHHLDGDHFNNSVENLELKSISQHQRDHKLEKYGYEDSLDMDEILNEYQKGTAYSIIAQKIGCDPGTIRDRLEVLIDIRSQSEQLKLKDRLRNESKWQECRELYEKGWNTYELSEFYEVHNVTISEWIRKAGGSLRESNLSRYVHPELASLNHEVLDVKETRSQSVYNMEVMDTKCYFANGVVMHNCPKTGQPDFATIKISYVPDKECIETKSLKLYLFAYRQHGSFMEAIVNKILYDLCAVCWPHWMLVEGSFNTRGGISLKVSAEYDENTSTPASYGSTE